MMVMMIIGWARLYVPVHISPAIRSRLPILHCTLIPSTSDSLTPEQQQQEDEASYSFSAIHCQDDRTIWLETKTISFRAEESNERLYYLFPTIIIAIRDTRGTICIYNHHPLYSRRTRRPCPCPLTADIAQ